MKSAGDIFKNSETVSHATWGVALLCVGTIAIAVTTLEILVQMGIIAITFAVEINILYLMFLFVFSFLTLLIGSNLISYAWGKVSVPASQEIAENVDNAES
ncbi:MAG: hypothetical protein LBI69_03195 [Puniceicoccales bacterium]|jgi:hypothetical protein|nr:hypothetical protein [Puniceicoccales bacterium]